MHKSPLYLEMFCFFTLQHFVHRPIYIPFLFFGIGRSLFRRIGPGRFTHRPADSADSSSCRSSSRKELRCLARRSVP